MSHWTADCVEYLAGGAQTEVHQERFCLRGFGNLLEPHRLLGPSGSRVEIDKREPLAVVGGTISTIPRKFSGGAIDAPATARSGLGLPLDQAGRGLLRACFRGNDAFSPKTYFQHRRGRDCDHRSQRRSDNLRPVVHLGYHGVPGVTPFPPRAIGAPPQKPSPFPDLVTAAAVRHVGYSTLGTIQFISRRFGGGALVSPCRPEGPQFFTWPYGWGLSRALS